MDNFRNKIYIVTGLLNSEMYQFDFDFHKIPLSAECNVDFLKFPTEWGVITNIILDNHSGFLYAFISTRQPYGFIKINTKDLSLDLENYEKFGIHINTSYTNYYTKQTVYNQYFRIYSNMNISVIKDGNMYVFPNNNYNYKKIAKVELYGCAPGLGIYNNTCNICEAGKYNDEIGGYCKDCNPGYASNVEESIHCDKCEAGKYTTSLNNIYCLDCEAGKYANLEGSAYCKNCNAGKYSIVSASQNENNCLNCEIGKISEEGETSCTFCEIGKWAKNNIECIGCSKGKYSSSLGLNNDNMCILCPIGKYNNNIGSNNILNCITCEDRKIGIVEGAISNTSYKLEAGKYKDSLTNVKFVQTDG